MLNVEPSITSSSLLCRRCKRVIYPQTGNIEQLTVSFFKLQLFKGDNALDLFSLSNNTTLSSVLTCIILKNVFDPALLQLFLLCCVCIDVISFLFFYFKEQLSTVSLPSLAPLHIVLLVCDCVQPCAVKSCWSSWTMLACNRKRPVNGLSAVAAAAAARLCCLSLDPSADTPPPPESALVSSHMSAGVGHLWGSRSRAC